MCRILVIIKLPNLLRRCQVFCHRYVTQIFWAAAIPSMHLFIQYPILAHNIRLSHRTGSPLARHPDKPLHLMQNPSGAAPAILQFERPSLASPRGP